MIEIAGHIIQKKLLERARRAGYFPILADGTTDISKIEHFCLVLRQYFDRQLREDFLEYVDFSGATTGEALTAKILARLKHFELDLKMPRGQVRNKSMSDSFMRHLFN